MAQTKISKISAPNGALSLSDEVKGFCIELLRLKSELEQAHLEIQRLRTELATRRRPPSQTHFRSLRRQISFYCHPDRGGDEKVMQHVNALFDELEQ